MRLRPALVPGLAAVVVAVAALALGHGRSTVPAAMTSAVVSAKTTSIKIVNYAYGPAALTAKVGTKLTVTNADQTAHTLTARSGSFDSGTVNPGGSKTFVLTRPGQYTYYCQFHAFMTGTITVLK
ncbi:MAG: cupredoxin domain-containing protein [Actinomycetota bacterium]|nr:cupredoxin domain-containing protein [Actinomycetota bacterium]